MFFFGALQMLALTTISSFVTGATHDKLEFEVEIKRHGKSIEWNEKLSNTRSKEFKTFSGLIKSQIKNDLNNTLRKGVIDVKSCREGSIFCTVEYKGECNFNMSIQCLEEHLGNLTVDIASREISWKIVDITLQIVSVKWLEVYSDPNSAHYKALISEIEAALFKAFENTTDIFNFEIHRLFKGSDNSALVQLQVVVDSASDRTSSDLEETVEKSTGSSAFGGMAFSGVQESDANTPFTIQGTGLGGGGPVLIVLAATTVSVVIVAFAVRIVYQNWKYAREHSPRAQYESYRRRKVEHDTNTEEDALSTTVSSTDVELNNNLQPQGEQ